MYSLWLVCHHTRVNVETLSAFVGIMFACVCLGLGIINGCGTQKGKRKMNRKTDRERAEEREKVRASEGDRE